jgi:hypothetical protein
MKSLSLWSLCLGMASFTFAQAPEATKIGALLSAVMTGDDLVIESKGGMSSYKAVLERKKGGNITQLCLPPDGPAVVRDLNDLFFHGRHGKDYTLRGWTGRSRCILSCSMDVLSRKPDGITVQVHALAAGTFKIIATDEAVKAKLKGKFKSYQEKTVAIKRVYEFKPDRVLMTDEVAWLYPDMEFNSLYLMASFLPGCVQCPARLVTGAEKANFYPVSSSGDKLPQGIAYPFISENFLKSGWKVNLLTTEASFDLKKSSLYFYERPWQQDWHQVSGFIYDLSRHPQGQRVSVKNEVVFAKASMAEMPPVITIGSPGPEARFMDVKDEVAKYKIGDVVKLTASAINSDGSPVADKDMSWEIRMDRWWKRQPTILQGPRTSYTLPDAGNEEERAAVRNRPLMAVIKVTAKGKNGTEATEYMAMLVGNPYTAVP